MTKSLWYAVNGYGQGRVFTTLPERNEHFKIWEGESVGAFSTTFMIFESDGFKLPDMSWKDDPIELNLTLDYGK